MEMMALWNKNGRKSVLDVLKDRENPLADLVYEKTKLDEKEKGQFFVLKNI